MNKEITIIGLPPALIEYPISGSTAVLSYLVEKGFKASIRYLNISMEKCFYHKKNDIDRVGGIIKVAPFLYLINRDLCHDLEKAETVKKTVVARGFVEEEGFEDWVNSVAVYVNEQMRLVAEKKSLLVAFTSKFFQWIPAIYCSHILKQINPSIPIYIGGQNTSEESYSLLRIGKYFDFSGHTVLACDVKNDSKWPVDLLLKIHSGIDPEKNVSPRKQGEVDYSRDAMIRRYKARKETIADLKTRGIIGENSNGMLAFVTTKKEQESVVREENRDRRQLYKMIAEKNNQTREVVAARAAIRFAERAKTGEYLMQNGEWRKKQ